MILHKQYFPSDNADADHKADNGAATTGKKETPLPTDKGTPKASVTPPMDVVGKPDTAPQEPTEKIIPGTVAPIHAKEPQLLRKEHTTDRRRESQGQTDYGNFHKTDCHDSSHKQENRKKRHHHPVRNGKTLQCANKLENASQPANRPAADEAGNDGKQKTIAERRRNCKPQPIQGRNCQSHSGNASGESLESHGQEATDMPAPQIGKQPCPDNRPHQGHEKQNKDYDVLGVHPQKRRTSAGTRKDDSLSKPRHTVGATGNKATCKTLAEKRGKHAPQQTTVSSNPRTTEGQNRRSAGGKPWSKDVLIDTGNKKEPGGLPHHANSQHRKKPPMTVYDPCLGRHPIPVCDYKDLMALIADDTNFLEALRKVNSKPHKAAGYDHKDVREVCTPLLASKRKRDEIRNELMNGTFQPYIVRTKLIPKKNGKWRTLGIAIVLDRIVQTMIIQVISRFFPEGTWSPFSFAYQEKRSVANAITEVNHIREEGYEFCVCLDLKAFFDNVPHYRLMEKLKVHLRDPRVIDLVTKFLTPVIAGRDGGLTRNRLGTPQGSVLSPWLASMLYLHELDMELTQRRLCFVRYADDVTIFCHSLCAAKRVRTNVIHFIEDIMKCPVNREKTTIVSIRKLALLGVCLDKGRWHIQRDKEKEICGSFLRSLELYSRTKNLEVLRKAVARMTGFIQHYRRIPGLARKDLKDLAKWSTRNWIRILGKPWGDEFKSRLFLQLYIM